MGSILSELLSRLGPRHQAALTWFVENAENTQSWPEGLEDGTLLATKAKGIYKPRWSEYALSVRVTPTSEYHDKLIQEGDFWRYRYSQEGSDPNYFTNRGLRNCLSDCVPVGVMGRVKPKPDALYRILGVALVADYSDDGFFDLRGFTAAGACDLKGVKYLPSWIARIAKSLDGKSV